MKGTLTMVLPVCVLYMVIRLLNQQDAPLSDRSLVIHYVWISSLNESLICFLIFNSLLTTMEHLRAHKQHAKLAQYSRLSQVCVAGILSMSAYNVLVALFFNRLDAGDFWRWKWM